MRAVAGVVGLGKLGLPFAVTLAMHGYEVLGYDLDPARMSVKALARSELGPDGDRPLVDCVDDSLPLSFVELDEVVNGADCVFVTVQTPHEPLYEGITPLPDSRADFGYDALTRAIGSVVERASQATEIGVLSTVMPGTIRSRLLPLVDGHSLVYCPQFVAMGTVARDLRRPEFTLLGRAGEGHSMVRDVLADLGRSRVFAVSYESAELAKVVYNTFISAKVAVANVVQRMSAEIGASATDVYSILTAADQRLTSAAYLGPGMGDGGPCHPRDNIALSWLARRVGMGADLFTAVMQVRQGYVEWLAERFVSLAGDRPLVLLGTAFKPGTELETGSSAVLMANLLRLRQAELTVVGGDLDVDQLLSGPAAFFVGCPDPAFTGLEFPAGSVVVDPWHRVPPQAGVSVVWIGEP